MNWYNIKNGEFPNLDEPVLLAKEPTINFINDCRLGRMVLEDNSQEKGWFVDNDKYVIALDSRIYWTPVLEKQHGVVKFKNEQILKDCLKINIEYLKRFEKKFQFLAACMISSGKGIYSLDFLSLEL